MEFFYCDFFSFAKTSYISRVHSSAHALFFYLSQRGPSFSFQGPAGYENGAKRAVATSDDWSMVLTKHQGNFELFSQDGTDVNAFAAMIGNCFFSLFSF